MKELANVARENDIEFMAKSPDNWLPQDMFETVMFHMRSYNEYFMNRKVVMRVIIIRMKATTTMMSLSKSNE